MPNITETVIPSILPNLLTPRRLEYLQQRLAAQEPISGPDLDPPYVIVALGCAGALVVEGTDALEPIRHLPYGRIQFPAGL